MRKLSVNDLWISSWILRRQRRPLPSSLLSPCHSPVWNSCLPSFAYSVVRFQEPQTLGYPEHQAQDFWWRWGHGGGSWDEYPPRDPHLRLGHVFLPFDDVSTRGAGAVGIASSRWVTSPLTEVRGGSIKGGNSEMMT